MDIDYSTAFLRLVSDIDLDPFSVKYCMKRLKNEGIQFLTETLPKLGKSVLKSLELGYFDRTDLTCFAWKGRSLLYFRSLLEQIFDTKTGKVLENVCPVALWQIRQLSEYFYKLSLKYSDNDIQDAEESFIQNDNSLCEVDPNNEFAETLRKDFETFYSDISRAKPESIFAEHRPRFGVGSYSSCIPEWYTHRVQHHHTTVVLNEYRGMSGFFKPRPSSRSFKQNRRSEYNISELLFVPKDSRGPRTIVREPLHHLRAQLGFFDWFTSKLEYVSNHRINFRDQQINRDLAYEGSLTKEWATLDLSDASDRVSYRFVKNVFRNSPAMRYFTSKRAQYVQLPSGKLHLLQKLSGMGSGYTFPTLALICHMSATRAIVDATRIPYNTVRKFVYVYGDDIIVPTKYVEYATIGLRKAGLKVNVNKTFFKSHFRESCGADYFRGNNVAPIRLKLSNASPFITGTSITFDNSNMGILSLERHCRELIKGQLFNLASYYYTFLESKVGRLHEGTGDTPYLCRYVERGVSYQTDETGMHKFVKLILPTSVKRSVNDFCEESFLATKLRSQGENTLDFLNRSHSTGSEFGVVSIPRKVSFKRLKVSSFALMG